MCYFNYLIGVSLMCSLPEQVVSRFLLHWKWSLKKAQQSNIAKGIRLKKKKNLSAQRFVWIWKWEVLMDKHMGLTHDSMDGIWETHEWHVGEGESTYARES